MIILLTQIRSPFCSSALSAPPVLLPFVQINFPAPGGSAHQQLLSPCVPYDRPGIWGLQVEAKGNVDMLCLFSVALWASVTRSCSGHIWVGASVNVSIHIFWIDGVTGQFGDPSDVDASASCAAIRDLGGSNSDPNLSQ